MKRRYLSIMILSTCLLYGCAVKLSADTGMPSAAPVIANDSFTYAATPNSLQGVQAAGDDNEAVLIRITVYSGQYGERLLIPCVYGNDYETNLNINNEIEESVEACIDQFDEPLSSFFEITANANGLISFTVNFYESDTDNIKWILPFSYNYHTGEKLSLDSYFDPANEEWRWLIPQKAAEQAHSKGIILLSDLLPLKNDQGYYIKNSKLILVYRPYEIAACTADFMQFEIPLEDIAGFFAEGCILNCFIEE